MDRRVFLRRGLTAGAACGATLATGGTFLTLNNRSALRDAFAPLPPAHAVIPVVGDGKWIWTSPPESETGYLEPRQYEVKIGIQLRGNGPAAQIKATTPVPLEMPEQQIKDLRVENQGCLSTLRQLAPHAGQLLMVAPAIARGQVISAAVQLRLTLHKDYRGFAKEQFPAEQDYPKEFRKLFLYDSPGIQTRAKEVRKLAQGIVGSQDHPWDKAKAFYEWVWENIQGRPQVYTSVVEALRNRVGDCEERAAVFIALCRAAGIAARLVWVPNHNWAEFCLTDQEGDSHWIPAHTSAYSWFGWTGAHELVLQKGDRISVPEKRKQQRLLADWMQWQGSRPTVRYFAELEPIASDSEVDAGPGARRKDEKGQWLRVGNHPLDPYMRDGERSREPPPK